MNIATAIPTDQDPIKAALNNEGSYINSLSIDDLRHLASQQRAHAATLNAKHMGVRAGWVSTEITIAELHAAEYEARADMLEACGVQS